ncbi:MAG: polysaccharide deacetylase family protein [Planctomycetaceae bacterium]
MPLLPAKRDLAVRALDATGLNRLLSRLGTWHGLLVLNYHRIGTPGRSPFDRDLWSAAADEFDRQLAHLKEHFDLVGLDDLGDVLHRRSGRHVMLTFDDGYRDNYEIAFPVLRRHAATATVFLATGFLDRPRVPWWDEIAWMVRTSRREGLNANVWTILPVEFDPPDRALAIRRLLATFKQLRGHETPAFLEFLGEAAGSGRCPTEHAADLWMTWDMVREMRRAGTTFGGHTVNHPVLASLPADEQDREIAGCKARLAAELREPVVAFSYPVGKAGAYDETTQRCLRARGFRWAFGYAGGYIRPSCYDRYALPRVAVETTIRRADLRALTALPQLFA